MALGYECSRTESAFTLGLSSVRTAGVAGCSSRKHQHFGYYANLLKARLNNPLPWRLGLIAYLLGLATVGYWPSPVDQPVHGTLDAMLKYLHGNGLPGWFDYRFVESSANVVLFVPFGVLTAMALPRKTWPQLAGIGLVASLCLELGQLVFITARFPTAMDVVTNTAGAVVGIASARLVTRRELQSKAYISNSLQS